MNDSDTAGMGTAWRDNDTDLCARIERLEKRNARLVIGVVGAGMLAIGAVLGGMGEVLKDDVIAYTATDETMYRVYESGKIEYLRLDDDPPRTVDGIFNWGKLKIDKRYELKDRPQ